MGCSKEAPQSFAGVLRCLFPILLTSRLFSWGQEGTFPATTKNCSGEISLSLRLHLDLTLQLLNNPGGKEKEAWFHFKSCRVHASCRPKTRTEVGVSGICMKVGKSKITWSQTPTGMMQHNKIIGIIAQTISTFTHTKRHGSSLPVKHFLCRKLKFDKMIFAFTLIT